MSSGVRVERVARPDWPDAQGILSNIEQRFDASARSIYRARNEIRLIEVEGREWVVKSFRQPTGINRYVYGHLRQTKARRSYANALRLQALGFCTPEPLGYQETYRGGWLAESFYVSAHYPPRYRLEEVLHGSHVVERDAILLAFGRFVWRLHAAGVLHRDLSPGNVLIRPSEQGVEFCLIDTNRMRFGTLSDAERHRNFAMLWAKDADLERIVLAYTEAAGVEGGRVCLLALRASRAHKARALRKERVKRWLGL